MVRSVSVCAAVVFAMSVVVGSAGCGDDGSTPGTGGADATSTTTTTTASATTASATTTTSTTSSSSGGGGGGGGGMVCTPGTEQPCYTGPSGTEGVGLCQAGTATCNAEGTVLGPCLGEVVPDFDNCASPADEDCDGAAPSCTGSHVWSKRFGDGNEQYGYTVASDLAGNVFIAGQMTGNVDFGGGPLTGVGSYDAFLAKLDPAGNHLWSKRFGDAASQTLSSVAPDAAGNVFVAGGFQGTVDLGGGPLTSAGGSEVFIAKLDPLGNHLWSKRVGQAGGASVATDASGNVVVTGHFSSTVDFGGGPLTSAGNFDVFVAKLDAAGNHLWSKRFGEADSQFADDVTTDAAGNVIVTGSFAGTADFGGGPLASAGDVDIFVAKLDPMGDHVWSKRFGEAAIQYVHSVATDSADNVLIAGWFEGSVNFGGGALTSAGDMDLFVAKLDAAGNHLWSKRFGDALAQLGMSVTADVADNVVIVGNFWGAVDFGGGPLTTSSELAVFVAKLDAGGSHVWSQRFGLADSLGAYDVVTDPPGNVLVTGDFVGTVDFGGGPLTSAGDYDVYIAKLAP